MVRSTVIFNWCVLTFSGFTLLINTQCVQCIGVALFAAPEVLDYVSLDSACDMWYVLCFFLLWLW